MPAGFEYALTLGLVSVAVTMMGAGAYSVDALRGRRAPQARALKIAA